MENITKEQKDIFWSKVDIKSNSECWHWLGAKKPKGYGNVRINKRYLLAHRVAWTITNFPIPKGYMVCHACDNPSCCNPNHLMLGTASSNMTDMTNKGRGGFNKNRAIGMRNPNAKLSWEQVNKIRELYASKTYDQYELAEKFNVSQPNIGCIVRYETRREA